MISETSFAKRFTSFWNELLPNAKNHVRLVNSAYRISTHRPLLAPERKSNIAFVNVLAFEIYRYSIINQIDERKIAKPEFRRSHEYLYLIEKSSNYLKRFSDQQGYELPLLNKEHRQAVEIAKLILKRYHWRSNSKIDPKFDGCGFINPAVGDILLDRTLVEIKSGDRPFNLQDLKQVLIYCTLNHYSKLTSPIERIELYNPRKGTSFSEEIADFAINLSALSPQQLFSEIESFISQESFCETSDF